MLTVGSLFSGIGGFDLGLERAGMRVLWQCEQDEFCRRVLAKHWPDVPCYEDVVGLQPPAVDVICGGFPCQDISLAGKGAGINGKRSGLWAEMFRIIRDLRPRYVLVENVSALLGRGLDTVLRDLASIGFDAEWDCIPASAVGAPHRRDRFWLVAYPSCSGRGEGQPHLLAREPDSDWSGADVADPEEQRRGLRRARGSAPGDQGQPEPKRSLQAVADTAGAGLEGRQQPAAVRRLRSDPASGDRPELGTWPDEPDLPRVVDGLPDWVDRMRCTGNALVPAIPEWIGRRILEWEGLT